jgi:hypothetical protein
MVHCCGGTYGYLPLSTACVPELPAPTKSRDAKAALRRLSWVREDVVFCGWNRISDLIRLPRRFTIRTLFVAMTLIAIALGLIVWAFRAR